MKTKTIFKKITVWSVVFSTILWSVGFSVFVPVAYAAVTVTTQPTELITSGQTAKASSANTAIAKFALSKDAAETLSSVTITLVDVGASGVGGTDIANLKVFKDEGDGIFGAGDLEAGSQTTINIGSPTTVTTATNNAIGATATTFFVTLATSATWSDAAPADAIGVGIAADGIATSANSPTVTALTGINSLTADTTAPTISKVERMNPGAALVVYSEQVSVSTAQNTSNYTFSDGLSVIEAVQEGPANYRIAANGNITTASTTLTISASVLDLAGNANATTNAQTIIAPVRVKLSEVSAEMGAADQEFIELVNDSDSATDISGWVIQSGAATLAGWTTLATIPGSTSIGAFKHYLLSTSAYQTASGIVPDATFTAGLAPVGGHIRIYNGSTEIDKIGWGTANTPEATVISAHSAGQSLERKAFGSSTATSMASGGTDASMGNGWDSNNNSFDFVVQTSPVAQNLAAAAEQPNYSTFGGGGPMIMHMPVNIAPTGSTLQIIAQMGDPMTPIANINAELHYMVGDGSAANNVVTDYTMVLGTHQSNGYFKFIVPQTPVDNSTTNGLYYYLKVTTDGGTAYMSASPTADSSGSESQVAQNPFIANVADGTGWTKHSIAGNIDDGTNPIEGALILLEGTGYNTTTDASGNYTLSNVKDGIYNLVIVKEGYYEEWIPDVFLNGANITGKNKSLFQGMGGGMTGDSEKPFVMWTGPGDGMFGIPPGDANFKVFIGFSKDLNSSTVNNSNIYLTTNGSTPIVSTVAYDNTPNDNMAAGLPPDNYLGIVSPPAGGFVANTTYYLVMTGNVRDNAGNSLQGNSPNGGHVISFTTGADFSSEQNWTTFGTGAMMPPFVMGVTPSDGSMNVVPNAKINITFSDPMDASSVTTSGNIKLYKVTISNNAEVASLISTSVSLDTTQKIATITPASNLTAGNYRVVVSGALKSANGIWMGDPGQNQNTASYEFYKSKFEVGSTAVADNTKPTVLGTWPADNATGIAVNPGSLTVQFSEGMDPASIDSNTITLKRGTTKVTGNVSYDMAGHSASFTPSTVLATNTQYTFTISGGATATSTAVTDAVGNPLNSNSVITFTTNSTGDTGAPSIMFANGDDYGIAITFSEPMNAANVTDTGNWGTSVLNLANYIIKWGDPGTVAGSGTAINLTSVGSKFEYDSANNTVIIKNLGLDVGAITGKDFYVNMTPATVSGTGAADLSGNAIAGGVTFQMPIKLSSATNGMLGPMTGGMMGMMGPDMGSMGIMMAGVFPMNAMAGQTTTYFVDIPTANQIADNYKIVLTFPTGFLVSGAKKDPYSPVNNDINEWNTGVISFSTEAESSGGANNDGVTIDAASRKITIDLAVSGTAPLADYLHLDLAGITNSSIPKGPETSGYTVDMKILDGSGNLKESVTGMPFFINSGGSASLSGSITGIQGADVDGTGDEVKVFLGSPMTGPMEAVASIDTNGAGSYSFSSLPAGQYMIFTDPTITLDSSDYEGLPMPQPITISDGANTKNIALTKMAAGAGKAAITVNITGVFGTDDIDIFAGSPNGFKVKTLVDAGTNPTATLYLADGDWMIGMGPAMPKGPMAGPPPMPDWMPPMPVNVKISGSGTVTAESSGTANDGTVAFTVSSANMQIIGYVKDDSGNAIADAEVFAYQPMGIGMGAFTKTDTNGKFTLKVAAAGTYSVGTFKQGLPNVPDRTVKVSANSGAVDGNATADIYVDSTLITASNTFIFKIVKPSTTISGKVTNGSNPVSYAPVWAYQQNGTGHADTMTDASGNYILYVGNGSWVVKAYIPGYGDSESQTVIINGSSETQNLSPDSAVTFYNIEGSVSIDGSAQAYMPIRAVKYDDNGAYTGNEYGSQTDVSGNYSISVPPGKYRVDIWTPSYGEVELTVADEVANSPANVVITSASKTGKNISIAALNLNTVTLAFTNGTAAQEGFVNIDGVSGGKPTGFHKSIKLSTLGASSTIKLPNGDYMFFMDVPGAGHFEPATNPTTVSGDATITFVLPDSSTELFAVSGQVTDGTDPIEGAWVWLGNKTTGVHRGITTDSSGNYSITIKAGAYKMGVEMPGYASQQPTDIVVSAAVPSTDYVLTASSLSISGRIYADADSDNTYDSGEQVANGWVWVEETTTSRIMGAPTDADGIFSISVIDGTYKLKGVADGYQEGSFGQTITISGSSSASKNIKLTAANNWTSKLKSKPITPANGGTIDDTGSSGSGVKVVAPPNALGSSSSSGNIKTQEVSTVSKTSSAEPLGGVGKQITATDNSGQAITNLNDEVEIELVYYKDDIEEGNLKDYGDLNLLTNSYWDSSVSDWVPLSTTKTAYTKSSASDAEWTTVTDYSGFVTALSADSDVYGDYKVVTKSTVDHLTVFGVTTPSDLDAPTAPANLSQTSGSGTSVILDWGNNSEADLLEYEIYRSTSAGVTAVDSNQVNTSQVAVSTFTDTTASAWTSYYYTITAVDDSGNESAVATEVRMCSNSSVSNGTVAASCAITCNSGYAQSGNSCVAASGGGGGGSGSGPASAPNYCSSVTYGEWSECSGGMQTREILGRSSTGCLMTLDQNNAKSRSCSATSDTSESTEISEDETETESSDDSKANETLTDKAKEYAERLQTILSEATDVFKVNINAILGKLGFKRDLAKEAVTVKKYVKSLIKDAAGLPEESQNRMTNFVSYGTETTQILGEGERAGVVNSYKAAFGKLPEKENEWADVIKIANGRWPGEINEQTERNALAAFRKIYLREPDRKNPNDDAAVVIIAYGLRPAKRNLDSEKVAIKTFKAIYGYYPKSASAWDIVRAIAYSGATR